LRGEAASGVSSDYVYARAMVGLEVLQEFSAGRFMNMRGLEERMLAALVAMDMERRQCGKQT